MSRLPVLDNRTHYRTRDLRALILRAIKEEGEERRSYRCSVRYSRTDRGCSGKAYVRGNWFQVNIPKTRLVAVTRARLRCARCEAEWCRLVEPKPGEQSSCPACGATNAGSHPLPGFRCEPCGSSWVGGLERGNACPECGDPGAAVPDGGSSWKADENPVGNYGRVHRRIPIDELSLEVREDLARVIAHELEHCRGVDHAGMCDSFKRAGEARGGGIAVPWVAEYRVRRVGFEDVPAPKADPAVARAAATAARVAKNEARVRLGLARWKRRFAAARTKVSEYRRRVAYYDRRSAAKGA